MNRTILRKLQTVKPPRSMSEAFSATEVSPAQGETDARFNVLSAVSMVGLNWETELTPLPWKKGHLKAIPGFFATYRSDTGVPLGVVKGRYRPNQNSERFNWLQGALNAGMAMVRVPEQECFPQLSFGGEISGGAQVFLGVTLETRRIGDTSQSFIMWVMDSNDKSTNYTIHTFVHDHTNNAIFCIHDPLDSYKVRHTKGAEVKLVEVQERVNWAKFQFDEYTETLHLMQEMSANTEIRDSLIYQVLGISPKDAKHWWKNGKSDDLQPQWVNQYESIIWILDNALGENVHKNTVYEVFRGIVTYYDQYRVVRGAKKKVSTLDNKVMGTSAKKKFYAYTVCRKFVLPKKTK